MHSTMQHFILKKHSNMSGCSSSSVSASVLSSDSREDTEGPVHPNSEWTDGGCSCRSWGNPLCPQRLCGESSLHMAVAAIVVELQTTDETT